MSWKTVTWSNFRQCRLVFAAFFLMVLGGYVPIGASMEKDPANSATRSSDTVGENVNAHFPEADTVPSIAAQTVRKFVRRGESQGKIRQHLQETTNWLRRHEDAGNSLDVFFTGIYGFIRGEFIDGGVGFNLNESHAMDAALVGARSRSSSGGIQEALGEIADSILTAEFEKAAGVIGTLPGDGTATKHDQSYERRDRPMIRILTAYTREIDDLKISVAGILAQLKLGERLLRNSVGILAFHPEFLETGVVRAVSQALPFDSVGGTTSNAAIGGVTGELEEPRLAVTVLTSDDVVFRAGVSGAFGDEPRASIRELYSRLAPPSAGKPSLLLMLASIMEKIGADDFIEALDALSGGVPLFGALVSSDDRLGLSNIATCRNGDRHTDALTLIAMFGEVEPKFFMSSIPDDKVIRQRSIITKAEKNQIQEINGLVPINYLEAIGLAENNSIIGMISIPFVLTLDDGSQVVRSVYRTTEEGHVLSFGTIPQGARIGFSNCGRDHVLQSARDIAARILASPEAGYALVFSCNARQGTLGLRTGAEMKELAETLNDSLAYQFAYSVGEFCPVKNHDGRLVNRFHNFSIIACLL